MDPWGHADQSIAYLALRPPFRRNSNFKATIRSAQAGCCGSVAKTVSPRHVRELCVSGGNTEPDNGTGRRSPAPNNQASVFDDGAFNCSEKFTRPWHD